MSFRSPVEFLILGKRIIKPFSVCSMIQALPSRCHKCFVISCVFKPNQEHKFFAVMKNQKNKILAYHISLISHICFTNYRDFKSSLFPLLCFKLFVHFEGNIWFELCYTRQSKRAMHDVWTHKKINISLNVTDSWEFEFQPPPKGLIYWKCFLMRLPCCSSSS